MDTKQSKPMFTHHLTDEQLYQYIIDKEEPSLDASSHLGQCGYCSNRADSIAHIVYEMAIAKLSEPSPQIMQRYATLFQHVQQKTYADVAVALWDALRATLLLDSREEMLAGTRSANVTSYRLLYTTDRADIELLVEPANRGRRLEGEILTLEEKDQLTPALLQLQNATVKAVLHETECNELGRFQFDEVQPDQYQLLITPLRGASIQIDTLNIT